MLHQLFLTKCQNLPIDGDLMPPDATQIHQISCITIVDIKSLIKVQIEIPQ